MLISVLKGVGKVLPHKIKLLKYFEMGLKYVIAEGCCLNDRRRIRFKEIDDLKKLKIKVKNFWNT